MNRTFLVALGFTRKASLLSGALVVLHRSGRRKPRITVFRNTLAVSLVLCMATLAPAAITITRTSAPTSNMPGYVTDTLTATTIAGEKIVGFDFVGGRDIGPYGFLGPMNQVNPAGAPTVFADMNAFFPFISIPTSPDQDSQFQVFTSQGIVINPSESSTSLKAAFNYSAANMESLASNVWSFVHIAHFAEVSYAGTLTIRNPQLGDRLEYINGILPAVPEPSSLALLASAVLGITVAIRRQRRWNAPVSMFRNTLAVALVFCLAASSQAALFVGISGSPTVGIAGMTTYTFTATAAVGEKIIGFDFAGGGGNFGITGPMNQVNPAAQPTIFQDNNPFFAFIPGADVSQDSQFKVLSTKGISLNASESGNSLKAAFNYNAASVISDASNVWSFVQIATTGSPPSIGLYGTMTVQNAQGANRLETVDTGFCLACYAPTVQDLIINNVVANAPGSVEAILGILSPQPAGPYTWSNFAFDSYVPAGGGSGTGPATPASFDNSTHKFTWNTVGSPLGTYKWLVTATTPYGSDQGSITVNITAVPEPATLSLFALAMAGALTVTSRRRA